MILNNKLYGILKYISLIVLPAIGALYFALAGIWGLPCAEQILGTIAAVDTFIGALLGISTRAYNQSGADEILHGGENDALTEEEHELVEPEDACINKDLGW